MATFGFEGGELRYLAKVANKGNVYVVVFVHELQTITDHLAGDSFGDIFQSFPFSHIAEVSALNTFTLLQMCCCMV